MERGREGGGEKESASFLREHIAAPQRVERILCVKLKDRPSRLCSPPLIRVIFLTTGSWRKRRALLVPHTFLYYFGEKTAATDLRPHGVIDLQLYTNVQVVEGEFQIYT